jgi:hypothetical protein
MTLQFERLYPWLFAAGLAGLAWKFHVQIPVESKSDLLSASISVGAILAGFLTTAKAIFMALPATSIKSDFLRSGYIADLARYMAEGICSCLAFCVLNLLGFFLSIESSAAFNVTWCFVGALSFLTFGRVTHIMLAIFKSA